jgi:preprotein translocase subunit SecE
MADSKTNKPAEKKAGKSGSNRFVAYFTRMGKGLAAFFAGMKAETKRIMWPDRKKLVQSTATVLAIIVIAGAILFAVDSLLGGILTAVGFYTPAAPAETTATTVVTETSATEPTVAEVAETTAAAAASETTAAN